MFKKNALLVGILLLGLANIVSAQTTLFTENFGTDAFTKSQWVEKYQTTTGASNRWLGSTPGYGDSGYAAKLTNEYETYLTMVNGLNTTGATEIVIDLQAMIVNNIPTMVNSNGFVKVLFNKKNNTNTFTEYHKYVEADLGMGAWHNITITLTDPNYMFDGFKVQLDARGKQSNYNRDEYLDEITVTANFSKEPQPSSNPIPAAGSINLATSQQLSWQPGYLSISHDVYFGTDLNLVTNAIKTSALCVSKDQTTTTYSPALSYNKTYYWRIDENYDNAGTTSTLKGTVWSFSTLPAAPANPNLVGWWKMDDTTAGTIADSSGYFQNGTLAGDAAVVADPCGERGLVLTVDGAGDYGSVPASAFYQLTDKVTISLWAFGGDTLPVNSSVFEGTNGTLRNLNSHLPWSSGSIYWHAGCDTATDSISKASNADNEYKGTWNHWAFTKDAASGEMKMYFNGTLWHSNTGRTKLMSGITVFKIGSGANGTSNFYKGYIDDFRVYNKVLTETEIQTIGQIKFAINPSPVNGTAALDNQTPTLTWTKGLNAVKHDVYFGTTLTDVKNSTAAVGLGTYKGRLTTNSYMPGTLQFSTKYYWRVDELDVSNNIVKGKIWSFTLNAFRILDDMEGYNLDTNPINSLTNWKDWTVEMPLGSEIYLGISPNIKKGLQSLEYRYSNSYWSNTPYTFSQIEKEFATVQDWSFATTGIKSLAIPFLGLATNGADRLFVTLEDDAAKSYTFYYKDPNGFENPNILRSTTWQNWEIDLNVFKNQNVNLAKIKKIFIGAGTRLNQSAPNPISGTLYLDELTLNPPLCRPELQKPVGDISNNCVVDLADIKSMADSWLEKDIIIPATAVNSSNLVGRWNFDNGDTSDSSGYQQNGTLVGNAQVINDADAARGNVLSLDGTNSYVRIGDFDYTGLSHEFSLGFWFKTNGEIVSAQMPYMFSHGSGIEYASNNLDVYLRNDTGKVGLITTRIILNGLGNPAPTASRWQKNSVKRYDDSQWHYYTVTLSTTVGTIYVDGDVAFGPLTVPGIGNALDPNQGILLGARDMIVGGVPTIDRFFNGMLDDVRLYSRVLSQGEILTLAGIPQGIVIPVNSEVNLSKKNVSGQEVIDYKDFSVLGKNWLNIVLWP